MDPNTSTTEPDTDYQSLILEPNFFHNSYLLQIPQPSKQVISKKPNTCPNQRFVLLLRNLICEQVTCRFERTANLGDITSQTCSQFKFFLNSLEILCHYLNIIKPENYKYRLKDYGPYKKHLVGFPQKVETGAIITMQTYSSTLQNPDFSALNAKLSMLSRKDEMRKKISMCCQEYAFYSAQYHLRLNSIFKELNRLGTLLDNISKNWKQENQKLGSIIYEEGIWDNNKKLLYVSELNDLLRAFEASIRDYERVLIKCTIMLVDFEVEDAKRYKYSYGELRTEGSINNYNCYETPTDMMNVYNMVCKTEESMPSYAHNISHWLSDSTGGKSPRFGKNRSQLNLLELQSENVTPNIHNIKQRIYVHSSSKRQSTLKRINETNLHVVPGKAPVEVKPWAEMNVQQQQPIKTASYMTPTEGKRNFSFRNADTSVAKTANYNAHTKSIVKCNQTIKFSPNWEAMEAGPKKVKEIAQPSLQRVPSAPRAIPVTKSSYIAKGSRETTQIRNPMPSYFNEKKATSKKVEGGREEDKGDQIRRLFQQSNFYKGKVGASSKLLKFR